MTVKIVLRDHESSIPAPISLEDALEQLHLDGELYVVLRNGIAIKSDEILQDGDVVRLIPVMIGG